MPFLYVIPRVDTFCSGKKDTLIAFHDNSILWSPSNSLSCATCDTVLTNAAATTKYFITATTPFGCTAIDSISVKVLSAPFVATPLINDTSICLHDTVQLNVGPAGKRIIWSPSAGLSDPNIYAPFASPDTTTRYTATLIDSIGCFISRASITVRVSLAPSLSVFPSVDTLCSARDTLIAIHSDSITWSPSASLNCSSCDTVITNAMITTQYFVTARNKFGCTAIDSVLVKVLSTPFVAKPILSNPSICHNDTVTINVDPPGKRIVWFPAAGLSDANNYAPVASPAQTTTYTATLTDSIGCFTSSTTITVRVNPLPLLSVIPNLDTLCLGVGDTLIALHSDSITWSPSSSLSCATCDTVITRAQVDTKYFVTATSKFGCTSLDSISVKVIPPFTAISVLPDPYICPTEEVRLNVDPPGKIILWSPATGLSNPNIYTPIASPTQTTSYTATLADSTGCFTSVAKVIVHVKSLPTVDAGPDKIVPSGAGFFLSPSYSSNVSSYSWTPSAPLSCSTCPAPTGVGNNINTFVIKVTSDSGCTAQDAITITIRYDQAELLVPNAFSPGYDNVNDYFFPSAHGVKTITLFSVYNRFGKLVFEAKNFPPNDKTFGWDGKLKGADQTTSVFVYYIEAITESGQRLHKKGSVVLLR